MDIFPIDQDRTLTEPPPAAILELVGMARGWWTPAEHGYIPKGTLTGLRPYSILDLVGSPPQPNDIIFRDLP